jgi:hypothetical protein
MTWLKSSIVLGGTCTRLVQSSPCLLDLVSWGKGIGVSSWRWASPQKPLELEIKRWGDLGCHDTFTNW